MLDKLIDDYFATRTKLEEAFKYHGVWRVLPFCDARSYYWRIDGENVVYADSLMELESGVGNCYSGGLYRGILNPGTEQFTLVGVDTMCDGDILLMIFDNAKEAK